MDPCDELTVLYCVRKLVAIVNSCRSSVDFSVKVAWLLGAYSSEVRKPNWRNSQGIKLKNMILNDELKYVDRYLSLICNLVTSVVVTDDCD